MSLKRAKLDALVEPYRGGELDPHYLGFIACFNRGDFYEAHEVLEVLWLKERQGAEGQFYQGLIQLAGAYVHCQKGRPGPAATLFKLAQARLEGYSGMIQRLEVGAIVAAIGGALGDLEKGSVAEVRRIQLRLGSGCGEK